MMGPINDSFQFCIFFLQEFRKLIKKRVTEKKKKDEEFPSDIALKIQTTKFDVISYMIFCFFLLLICGVYVKGVKENLTLFQRDKGTT